jgi:hypothetical protein
MNPQNQSGGWLKPEEIMEAKNKMQGTMQQQVQQGQGSVKPEDAQQAKQEMF